MSKTPDSTDVYVGRRLRAARLAGGVTQEALAHAIGLTFQQVQKYEKGINRISASRMQHIGAVLNLSPSYFFEGLPANGAAPSQEVLDQNAFMATAHAAEIARLWPRVVAKGRAEVVLSMIRMAAS